jgi:hypothetical protein
MYFENGEYYKDEIPQDEKPRMRSRIRRGGE